MVAVLATWDGKSPLPDGCVAGEGVGIFRLERPKLSYAPPGLPTLWIRRDGYRYDYFADCRMSPEEVASAQVEQLERFLEHGLKSKPPEYHTGKTLEGQRETLRMSRNQMRAALTTLQARGRVLEKQLPAERRHGGRQTFQCPINLAGAFGEVVV